MVSPNQFVVSKRGGADLADDHHSTTPAQHGAASTAVLTCILVSTKDSEPFLAILQKLAADSANAEQVTGVHGQ